MSTLASAAIFGQPDIHPNAARILDLLAWCEATATSSSTQDRGYDIIVTGKGDPAGGERFSDYTHHPFGDPTGLHQTRPAKLIRTGVPPHADLRSTASGRYQIILGTYTGLARRLGTGGDFSPLTQDRMALELITAAHALPLVEAGNVGGACALLHEIWASLPGSTAGQGGKSHQQVLDYWYYLGKFAPYLGIVDGSNG